MVRYSPCTTTSPLLLVHEIRLDRMDSKIGTNRGTAHVLACLGILSCHVPNAWTERGRPDPCYGQYLAKFIRKIKIEKKHPGQIRRAVPSPLTYSQTVKYNRNNQRNNARISSSSMIKSQRTTKIFSFRKSRLETGRQTVLVLLCFWTTTPTPTKIYLGAGGTLEILVRKDHALRPCMLHPAPRPGLRAGSDKQFI